MNLMVVRVGVGQLDAVRHALVEPDALEVVVPAAHVRHHVEAHEPASWWRPDDGKFGGEGHTLNPNTGQILCARPNEWVEFTAVKVHPSELHSCLSHDAFACPFHMAAPGAVNTYKVTLFSHITLWKFCHTSISSPPAPKPCPPNFARQNLPIDLYIKHQLSRLISGRSKGEPTCH